MTTAELIVHHREAANLSRAELADRCGLSLRTLEKIEQNVVKEPKLVDVAAIANVLGMTCKDFIPNDVPPPPRRQPGRPKKDAGSASPPTAGDTQKS